MRAIAIFGILLATSTIHHPITASNIQVDSHGNVTRFYGVPIKTTISALKRLPYATKISHEKMEGDIYTIAIVTAKSGVKLRVTFDLEGHLYFLETSSLNAVTQNGVGIGSTLSQIKSAWPSGRLFYGVEEGKAGVKFATGTNVLYTFDPKAIPPGFFGAAKRSDVELANLRVRSIQIFAFPVRTQS